MKRLYVIGNPITHSKSPLIHNFWLRKYSIDCVYEKKQITQTEIPDLIEHVREGIIKGFNVTIPFKKIMLNMVDTVDLEAKKSMAVNTVYKRGDKVVGTNTDGIGFVNSLKKDVKYILKPKSNIFCVGSGGAAYGIISEILNYEPTSVKITNRTESSGLKLINHFSQFVNPKKKILKSSKWGTSPDAKTDLLINTTSCGMKKKDNLPIRLNFMPSTSIVYDIIYNPKETMLMRSAINCGIKNTNGAFMLIRQAAESFKKWFDIELSNEDISSATKLLLNND